MWWKQRESRELAMFESRGAGTLAPLGDGPVCASRNPAELGRRYTLGRRQERPVLVPSLVPLKGDTAEARPLQRPQLPSNQETHG